MTEHDDTERILDEIAVRTEGGPEADRRLYEELRAAGQPDEAIAHSQRFRRVSRGYARRVAEAYAGNLGAAMEDSDEQVAAVVKAWEQHEGLAPRDWVAIGAEERGEVT